MPLVRQQIEYKIKGRKEVNIALSDAEREFSIIDRKNPNNYLVATADDIVYYKNNKGVYIYFAYESSFGL